MIVNIADLPDTARRPLVLAVRLQALSVTFEKAGDMKPVGELGGELGGEFKAFVDQAKRDGLIPSDTVAIVDEKVRDIEQAAELLWSIGLLQLRKAIGEGKWLPTDLDLTIKPKDDPILAFKARSNSSMSYSNLAEALEDLDD